MDMVAILFMWPWPFEQAFVPPSQGGSILYLASIGLVVIEEKKFKNTESERFGSQGQWLTLTFGTHKASYDCTIASEKSIVLPFAHTKA